MGEEKTGTADAIVCSRGARKGGDKKRPSRVKVEAEYVEAGIGVVKGRDGMRKGGGRGNHIAKSRLRSDQNGCGQDTGQSAV